MSLLTEYDSTVIAAQTSVALQGGGGGGGGNIYITGGPNIITGGTNSIQVLGVVSGNSFITAGTVNIGDASGSLITAGQIVITGAGSLSSLLVTGAISGLSTLTVTGLIKSTTQVEAPLSKTDAALIPGGLAVSSGYLGFLGAVPIVGPLFVTSNNGVTGIMAALEAYGLIISRGNA